MDLIEDVKEESYHVQFCGQFTFGDHPAFRNVLKRIEEEESLRLIVFDVGKLDFIDSSGLGMLLLAHDAAEKKRKKLVIKNVGGQIQKMFALAHFQSLFVLEEAKGDQAP